MAANQSSEPVRVFCAYPDRDQKLYQELRLHLAPQMQNNEIDFQGSQSAPPGSDIREFREEGIAKAQVLVLFVSAGLIADGQWRSFLKRRERSQIPPVPVSVRTVDLADTPLADCQLLPRYPTPPLQVCRDRDAAWSEITREVREIARAIRSSPAAGTHADSSTAQKPSLEDVRRGKEHAHGLKYRGRGKEALQELHLAFAKLDELALEKPDDIAVKKERAHLHDRIGQCEYALGHFEEARKGFDSAYEIRLRLRDSNPGDSEALFDLSTSHFWRGYLAYLQGDLAVACEEQRRGMEACRALRERNANHLQAARSLVVLETDLGTTLHEMKDSAGAVAHLRNALDLARKLAAQNPDNWQLERDVSVGLFRLADLLVGLGEIAEAATLCEESVQRCWGLARWAPTNVQWRRHLATARISMGDIRLAHDDLTLARGDYEFATGTMGALAALEVEDVQGTRHYARAEKKLGELLSLTEDHRGAMAAHLRAAAAMETACRPATIGRWDRELEEIYADLLRAHAAVPGADPAIAAQARTRAQELRGRGAATSE